MINLYSFFLNVRKNLLSTLLSVFSISQIGYMSEGTCNMWLLITAHSKILIFCTWVSNPLNELISHQWDNTDQLYPKPNPRWWKKLLYERNFKDIIQSGEFERRKICFRTWFSWKCKNSTYFPQLAKYLWIWL